MEPAALAEAKAAMALGSSVSRGRDAVNISSFRKSMLGFFSKRSKAETPQRAQSELRTKQRPAGDQGMVPRV